jgi:creatinine amidohydrolase
MRYLRTLTGEREAEMKHFFVFLCMWLLVPLLALSAGTPDTVILEELTWPEVRDAIKAGKTTIIFPTGGTEQNGPHMVLGKHNYIVAYTAEQIARKLGNALVAPVLAYVPEGELDPPTGHMRFPGTITLPHEFFMKVTEYAARSFKVNGFKDIVFIGDSGPNQKGLQAVSEMLNKEWASTNVRVHFIPDYYRELGGLSGGNGFNDWLKSQGETPENIGTHAGISDTSQLMALNPKMIRMDKLAAGGDRNITGVSGNPTRASIAYGKKGLELKIVTAVAQIQKLMQARNKP